MPQNFGMFELGKITFGVGQNNILFQTIVCKASSKADILSIGLKIKKHSLELATTTYR